MTDETTSMIVRQTFNERDREIPAAYRIECLNPDKGPDGDALDGVGVTGPAKHAATRVAVFAAPDDVPEVRQSNIHTLDHASFARLGDDRCRRAVAQGRRRRP